MDNVGCTSLILELETWAADARTAKTFKHPRTFYLNDKRASFPSDSLSSKLLHFPLGNFEKFFGSKPLLSNHNALD